MAQQSARRGRKNQMYSSCLEHAFMIWFRSANSHTGPQLHRCIIRGRTDGSIRLRANLLQKPLASRGASTDEYTLDSFHLNLAQILDNRLYSISNVGLRRARQVEKPVKLILFRRFLSFIRWGPMSASPNWHVAEAV